MNIRIKKLADTNSVKVNNRGTASFTKLADDLRDLTPKEYKQFVKLARLFRKADKAATNWQQLDNLIGRARTLTSKEYKTCVKLGKDLRAMDAEITKADKLEQKLKEQRFYAAQVNA